MIALEKDWVLMEGWRHNGRDHVPRDVPVGHKVKL